VCSNDDAALSSTVETELDKWGSAIASHVNRGGGLFATGHYFRWLKDLFPALTVTYGGTGSSYVTIDGAAFFPNLAVNTQVNAVNHFTFANVASTPLLPLLTASMNGSGQLVAIGGTNVRFPQISFTGPTTGEVGTAAMFTLQAADANGNPRSSNAFTWTITGPTTATGSGTATTDAYGSYSFNFAGNAKGQTRIAVQMSLPSGASAGSAITTTWATVPGAPTISSAINVTGTDGTVLVSWNAPADNGGKTLTDYAVDWSVDGTTWNTFADAVGTATSAQLTGLTNASSYSFRVAAINPVGQGAYSSSVAGTPIGSPGAPVLQSFTASAGQVTVNWAAPVNLNGGAVSDYVVEYGAKNSGTRTALSPNPTATTATVTGLTNGQWYDFRVSANNSNGQGAWSNVLPGTPLTVPDAPTASAVPGDGTITVAWTPGFDGGRPLTAYAVAVRPVGADTWVVASTTSGNSAVLGGLDNRVKYEVQVTALNAAGKSDPQGGELLAMPLPPDTGHNGPIDGVDPYPPSRLTLPGVPTPPASSSWSSRPCSASES